MGRLANTPNFDDLMEMNMSMTNTSGIADVSSFVDGTTTAFGSFRNFWRNRTVTVYAHPTDADLLITVGRDMVGPQYYVCAELRSAYTHRLAGDWSDYR
jgi:hypothetical protein